MSGEKQEAHQDPKELCQNPQVKTIPYSPERQETSAMRRQEPWKLIGEQLLIYGMDIRCLLDRSSWQTVQEESQSLVSRPSQHIDMSNGRGGQQELRCYRDKGRGSQGT